MKWIAAMLVALIFAGCVSDDSEPASPAVDAPEPYVGPLRAIDLPEFNYSVSQTVDWWENFVSPGKRDAYIPDTPLTFNMASRDIIAATLTAAGAEVQIIGYAPGALGIEAPPATPIKAWAIEAVWPGNHTALGNETVGDLGMIAHYDTQAGTIEGAYDNGSGTAGIVHTCIALSKIEMRRDLVCVLFDAEEEGAIASGAYADSTPRTFDLVIGFDMVGLNCPGFEWQMYQWVGANFAAELYAFVNQTAFDSVGDCVTVFDFNDRNSDESSFASNGIPTVRFAGGRTAGAYDEYHRPNDTPEHIYELTGGRANWELGFGATMNAAFDLAIAFDNTNIDLLREA